MIKENENRWEATQEQKEKFIPILQEFITKGLKNPETKEYIDFYNQGISPYQLKSILEDDLGFEDNGYDSNGWESDFWITMSKDGIDFMIAGTGMTFEMVFRLA